MVITDLKAWGVREPAGEETYVVVRLKTDQGLVGYGETHARPDAATGVARVMAARETLLGLDALAGEAVRRSLHDSSPEVRAAVDIALLDIKGKIAKAPIYEILSGRTRDKARAYAPLTGSSFAQLKTSLDQARAAGFRAFSLPIQIPAGPTRGRKFYADMLDLAERLRDVRASRSPERRTRSRPVVSSSTRTTTSASARRPRYNRSTSTALWVRRTRARRLWARRSPSARPLATSELLWSGAMARVAR